MIRRYVWALALVGVLAAGGAVAALASSEAGPTAAPATAASTLSSAALSSQAIAGTSGMTSAGAVAPNSWGPGGWGLGGGRLGGRFGRFGRLLTVTSVSGNTISARGRFGHTIIVQVSATTAYTEAGASAALSDIHAGSVIAVRGSYANTGATTINATGVIILLPVEAGVVTNVNGSTLTLTEFDGATRIVTVSASTRYQKAGQSAALSDITTGTAIVVEGTLNGNGSLAAVRVTIQIPRIAGQVTAVSGSSYTVTGRFGTTYTVATTSSTTYVNADGTTATASAVKTGVFIVAEGSLSSDGKTLTAQRVIIAPAGMGRRFGHGGFGQFGFGGAPGGASGTTPGASVPNTTGTQNI